MPISGPASVADRIRADLPFDSTHLDALLEEAGIDILLVTSKHNIRYLLGGYRFFFFDRFDALGVSRYLPILVYPRGRPLDAVYIGNAMEGFEAENGRFWCRTVETKSWGALDATELAIRHLRRISPEAGGPETGSQDGGAIGIELPFFPADAMDALRAACGNRRIENAVLPLERLRAVKTPEELGIMRQASERVIASMLATFAAIAPGMTKRDVSDRLCREETERGLAFDYCLLTAGTSFNRAPSEQVIRAGDIVSLDSGGSYQGYIGDMCRMGILGEPDAELVDLLGGIEEIQQAARRPIAPGTKGREIFAAVDALLAASPWREQTHFVAHGMGMISHEAPRLTDRGAVPYPAYDADRPLRAGMVISIETTLMHPRRGYIKLEDTLAVTETGWEAFGDGGRGWNLAGVALQAA